jgi:hypothetical protein
MKSVKVPLEKRKDKESKYKSAIKKNGISHYQENT